MITEIKNQITDPPSPRLRGIVLRSFSEGGQIRPKRTVLWLVLLFALLFLTYPEQAVAEKVKYTSGYLRDPFQSPFEEEPGRTPLIRPEIVPQLGHLQVQGMVWGSAKPQAIINNTVVRKGEIIGDAQIIDIQEEGVYVLYQGEQYIIRPIIKSRK